MSLKKNVIFLLFMTSGLILSACNPKQSLFSEETEIGNENISVISPILTPYIDTLSPTIVILDPTLSSENISNAISVDSMGSNLIKITNNSTSLPLQIYRRLINETEKVVYLQPQESYEDTVLWDGTQYFYWGEDGEKNITNEVAVITDISENTKKRGLFYDWATLAIQRNISDEIKIIDNSSKVFDYTIHGVDVKMVYTKVCVDSLTDTQMEGILLTATQMFSKHWQLYEGFPLSEYRITCWGKEVEYESELGHQIDVQRLTNLGNHNLLENDERLSHEIGHAWLGNIIGFENGWIWEGFDHFNGIVALDFRLSFLSADLKDERLINHKTEPLNGMYEKYFPTDDAYAYYAKGGIFAYLVSRKLEIETDMNYSGFMKYLYDRYFLSQNRQAQLTLIQGIVPNFQTALNSFSGIDFSDLFTSYVTGNEDIIKELRFEKIYLPAFK